MIDRIDGRIIEIEPTSVIVDVNGVGYQLLISLNTYEKVGRSSSFHFYTHLHVREDQMILFGFADKAEREAFRKLTSVSGVGPKVAQAILSSLSVNTLRDAVTSGDWKRLTAAPGVGKKLAERMQIELRDKFAKDKSAIESEPITGYTGPAGAVFDTVEALVALGYKQPQAEKLAARAAKLAGEEADVQQLLKIALKP